jgi:hypothetical protein
MQRIRNKKRWLSWIAVIAVLGNVLAGALGHVPAQAVGAIDEIVPAHLICTADGATDQAPDGSSTHCAICALLSTGFGLIVALAFAAIAFPSTVVFHPPRFGLRTLADHLRLGGIRSRAPPVCA